MLCPRAGGPIAYRTAISCGVGARVLMVPLLGEPLYPGSYLGAEVEEVD